MFELLNAVSNSALLEKESSFLDKYFCDEFYCDESNFVILMLLVRTRLPLMFNTPGYTTAQFMKPSLYYET